MNISEATLEGIITLYKRAGWKITVNNSIFCKSSKSIKFDDPMTNGYVKTKDQK